MNEQWIQTFQTEIGDFAQTMAAFGAGELDKKAYKGISGGMGSYAQHDQSKHMLRLRLPGGQLTKERLAFLARTVEEHQVELMKLTTCETIQLHNLKPEQVTAIMAAAIPYGIYTKGGGGDNPRNVMCSPLSGVQPGEAFDVTPYAQAASEYLLSICRDIRMPRKLKVAFCNGVDDSVHAAFRDMGFTAQPDGTFALSIAGGLGNNHRMGVPVAQSIPAGEILYYIRAMIDTFCQHGCYTNRAKARTRYMQETLGPDGLKAAFLENVDKRKAEGGLDIAVTPVQITKTGSGTIEDVRVVPQKQPGLYAVKYHPIGGLLPADAPARLSACIEEMPEVICRVGANETLWICNLTAQEAEQVLAATADGARTAFEYSVSCIGASICQQGVRDSQALLHACVQAVREAEIPDGALPEIHISGCPSSCSGHQAGAIGFQGCVKLVDKKPQPAFRCFLGGDDTLGKTKFGTAGATILEKDIPALLVELGKTVAESGQSWAQWAPENGAAIDAVIAKYA